MLFSYDAPASFPLHGNQTKTITRETVKNIVKECFEGDKKIFDYYDPNATDVKDLAKLSEDISNKIFSYVDNHTISQEQARFIIVYDRFMNTVGYFFYITGMQNVFLGSEVNNSPLLISFCVKNQYRQPEILKDFFSEIKFHVGSKMQCVLWKKNTRAINWLCKCGFVIDDKFNSTQIVRLYYVKKIGRWLTGLKNILSIGQKS